MKSIKINIPKGFEIDKEKSSFEEIIFKPISDFTYINLGLPSGTLWADKNIGANSSTDYGDYLTWDEAQKYNCPNKEQLKELIEHCNWHWVTKNNIYGYLVIGKNGNSIFLPAAGFRYDSTLYADGSTGYYWSRMLNSSDTSYAYYLHFNSRNVDTYNDYRYDGQSVRPVLNP